MRAPERWPHHEPQPDYHWPTAPPRPAAPTVYPEDVEVREGLLGPDGKPLAEGTRRRYPIGFCRP
jgi:hypothetical protein